MPRICKPYIKRVHPALRNRAQPWGVPALYAAYQWPTGLGGGGRIGIVELGGSYAQADIAQFCRHTGLPEPAIDNIGSRFPSDPNGADGEVALDIQLAAASYSFATGQPADIVMLWAPDIAPGVEMAQQAGCDVCSISWGSDEANWLAQDPASLDEMEAAATAATEAGMTIFAAAGDNDSSDGGPSPANVDAPASCPHVVSCGGTRKPEAGTETVWNDNPNNPDGSGTGGGFSTHFPVQGFQAGAPHGPGRMVPDITANADPITGYEIVLGGQWQPVGGTSAVAPLMAGLFAAFGKKLGFVTPLLWKNHLAFVDITLGNNGFYRAEPGPDPVSGIGRPIGTKLAALFASAATPIA